MIAIARLSIKPCVHFSSLHSHDAALLIGFLSYFAARLYLDEALSKRVVFSRDDITYAAEKYFSADGDSESSSSSTLMCLDSFVTQPPAKESGSLLS